MMFIYVLAIIMSIILLVLVSLVIIQKIKSRDEPEDSTFLLSFMPQYSGGFCLGKIIDTIDGDQRKGFIFAPRDINIHKRIINKKNNMENSEIEEQTVFFERSKLIDLPKGFLSKDVSIIMGLPPTASDFSTPLKKHWFGKILMELTEKINDETDEVGIMQNKSKRQIKMLESLGGLEIPELTIENLKNSFRDILSMTGKESKFDFNNYKNKSANK